LAIPAEMKGMVLFAHGSGSSRLSPRNRYVARVLQDASIATLLFDLLTQEEEAVEQPTAQLRFDIALLAKRLIRATDWLLQQPPTKEMKVGYFGASTGAAAALVAAVEGPHPISAIVSRGGRPDLASSVLPKVQAPTLLIVGGDDKPVIDFNLQAMDQLRCEKRLELIPGATHLFEEPGKLEEVAGLARDWFQSHLGCREQEMDAA
jgi:putative phosphoribosyl transferase